MLDLIRADVTVLRRQFSVVMEKTILELRGTSCLDVDDAPTANQQIMCSRSFGAPVADLPTLIEVVSQFTSQVARKLREQGNVAGAVQVFISTSPFRKNDRQHAPVATLPLSAPSADTRVLISAAVSALRHVHRPGFNYVKAGVMLVDLQAAGSEQVALDLFGSEPVPDAPRRNSNDLMDALDALNHRFGRNAVAVASAVLEAQEFQESKIEDEPFLGRVLVFPGGRIQTLTFVERLLLTLRLTDAKRLETVYLKKLVKA